MHAVIKNNEIVQTIQPFTRLIVDGNDYGSNWSVNKTVQELADIGVVEIVETPEPDQRFFWVGSSVQLVDGVPTRVHTATPKDLDELKTQWSGQVRQTAHAMCQPTDWTVIRKAERNVEIPANIAAERAAIFAECDRLVAAIAAASSVEELATAVATQNWTAE